MPYALVGYFDKETDHKIKNLWMCLADAGIDDYLSNSENNPHIKFMMYQNADIDKIKEVLFSLSKTISKFPIHFKTYNFYPNEKPFISIDMAAAKQILDLQTKIRSECDRYGELFGFDVFNEGIWKPDCQLTIEISKEKLLKAIAILLDTEVPFNGTLERIGVIEFHPAKQLFSFDLQ